MIASQCDVYQVVANHTSIQFSVAFLFLLLFWSVNYTFHHLVSHFSKLLYLSWPSNLAQNTFLSSHSWLALPQSATAFLFWSIQPVNMISTTDLITTVWINCHFFQIDPFQFGLWLLLGQIMSFVKGTFECFWYSRSVSERWFSSIFNLTFLNWNGPLRLEGRCEITCWNCLGAEGWRRSVFQSFLT